MTLRPRLPGPVALLGLALVGCGGDADPPAPTDAGRVDRPAVTDRGPVDATADASADVITTDATVPGDAASDAPAVDTGPAPVDAGRDAQVQVQCAAFGVEPARVRIATGAGVQLQPVGGSGRGALFTVREGSDTGGATLNVGGGLVAGPRAARFQVQAVDLLCPQQRASVEVEVVGPFEVEPAVVRVAPLRTLNFVARGNVGAVRWGHPHRASQRHGHRRRDDGALQRGRGARQLPPAGAGHGQRQRGSGGRHRRDDGGLRTQTRDAARAAGAAGAHRRRGRLGGV
jgi:hypothetical protein